MTRCPPWCTADHALDGGRGAARHHGETFVIPVVQEGRGHGGAQAGELVLEVSRRDDEAAVWVYLGDGWTGFSLSLESARRLSTALRSALPATGTLETSGL